MLTGTEVVKRAKGYYVKVNWGPVIETLGPYRWRWMARVVAWFEDGQH